MSEPNVGGGAPTGGQGGAPAPADVAEELRQANARIAELEALSSPDAIERRARDLLFEYVPEIREAPRVEIPSNDGGSTPSGHALPGSELSGASGDEEADIFRRIAAIEARQAEQAQEAQIQAEMVRISSAIERLNSKYPHMRQSDVLMALAQNDRLDIEKVCRWSHERELTVKTDFLKNELARLQTGPGSPPPVPGGATGGAPGSTPQRTTTANAAEVLARGLRAAGFEKSGP